MAKTAILESIGNSAMGVAITCLATTATFAAPPDATPGKQNGRSLLLTDLPSIVTYHYGPSHTINVEINEQLLAVLTEPDDPDEPNISAAKPPANSFEPIIPSRRSVPALARHSR